MLVELVYNQTSVCTPTSLSGQVAVGQPVNSSVGRMTLILGEIVKMNEEQFYIRMRDEVSEFATGRADSSAFLIWFLGNFFRLETQDAIDNVCDQTNDKGIDGIYVDDVSYNNNLLFKLVTSKFISLATSKFK